MSKLHITVGSGKMEGITSVNTPTTTNPFCQMMKRQQDSICSGCYAFYLEAFRSKMVPAFERNMRLLEDVNFVAPKIYATPVRFHSYGELRSAIHFANFVKIAFVNPDTTFTLWTKRPGYVNDYTDKGGVIPGNLLLVFSNPDLDCERRTPPKHFDKVFNVFSEEGAQEVTLNCQKKCIDCMLCYTTNDTVVINELQKRPGRQPSRQRDEGE